MKEEYIESAVREVMMSTKGELPEDTYSDVEEASYKAIKQAYEQGARDNAVIVSWDIAGGGSEWVVQFWRTKKDGTKVLIEQLDKNSDDGGNFIITPQDKPETN